jgi:hypothetical protein
MAAVLAALVVGAALAATGCGSDDEAPDEVDRADAASLQDALPPNVVSDRTIDRHDRDTPERTLLEWWQAFQFRDAELVKLLTDARIIRTIGRSRISNVVRRIGPSLQGIRILSRRTIGDTTSIRVAFLSFGPKRGETTPPSEPTAATPSTLLMTERRGRWVFADSSYLRELARNAGL